MKGTAEAFFKNPQEHTDLNKKQKFKLKGRLRHSQKGKQKSKYVTNSQSQALAKAKSEIQKKSATERELWHGRSSSYKTMLLCFRIL